MKASEPLRHVVVPRAVVAPGGVRLGNQPQQRLRLRRQPARRDDVAGELLAVRRIVDVHAVRAQVAAARRRGRHGQQLRAPLGGARPLVVAEEKPLVLLDRSADRHAELVALGLGDEPAGQRISLELRERVARLELVGLIELERAAVQEVGAGLGLDRHDARRGLAELGIVVLRRDFRFADRFERRVDDDDAENRIAVLRAVELIPGAAEVLAVDHRLRRPLRVLAGGMLPLELLRAGRQQDELGEVAIEHRQIGELLGVEPGRDVGAVDLQQRRSAGDHHLLGHGADRQREGDGCLRVHAHGNRRHDRGLEAGQFRLDLVGARQQPLFHEVAGLVGHRRVGGLPLDAGDRDRDAGQHGAASDPSRSRRCSRRRPGRAPPPGVSQQDESERSGTRRAARAPMAHLHT